MKRWLVEAVALTLCLVLVRSCIAQKERPKAFTDPDRAGPDFAVQGEYVGKIKEDKPLASQVVALGGGAFEVYFLAGGLPGEGFDGKSKVKTSGKTVDGKTAVTGEGWTGSIAGGAMTGRTKDGEPFTLKRVVRKSPTLGARPEPRAIVLFDGSSASEWEGGKLVEGNLLNNGIASKRKFQSFRLHLEFRLPFMPEARDQGRGNSGLYLQDRWEVQLLDSFGLKGAHNECGGLYAQFDPLLNACFPPLSWQTYDVEFHAAKFDSVGKKTEDAVVTIKHNGIVIHDRRKLDKGPCPGGQKESPVPGAFQLQNHGDPVYFRNIWVVELTP